VPERPALNPSAGASVRWSRAAYTAVALAGGIAVLGFAGFLLAAGPWTRWAGGAGMLTVAAVLAGHVRALLHELGEHQRRSRDLRGSEALLTGLFEACPDVITVTDPATGRYVMANPRFEEIIGYRVDEVLGRTVLELGLLPDQAERERLLGEVRREGRIVNFPMRYRARDGRTVHTELSGTFFTVGEQSYLLVVSHDVTERQRIEAEYRAIFDNASVGIALVRQGQLRQVNERFERMLGWEPGTLSGRPVTAIWPDEQAFRAAHAVVRSAMQDGRPLDFEWQMWRRDGQPFWSRSRATLLATAEGRDGQGQDTIWIVEDITEARQAAAELAAAKEQAEAASQAKSVFLANMSHEIRTPLHGVLGLAQLAAVPDIDASRRDDCLQRLVESARALSAVISDILDLSKIEAGRLRLEAIEFDLLDLLRSLHNSYAELARAKSLDFGFEVPPELPVLVCADPVRLRQILGNFLNNALKFTATGAIGLRVRPAAPQRWRFEVHDTGPGIDPGLHETLFQPFTQADDSTTRRYGGTGLGLSICRQLARLMGGDVGVISQVGEGSLFWAELPLQEVQPHTQPQDLPEPTDEALRGARVLVVEDNPVNMMIAVSMLERWGVEVVQAHDGQQAIEAVERAQGRFDAVLMDVHMPDMSGYEATERIRRCHDAAHLPIIALTAAAMVSEQQRARDCGMNDFLAKPIDLQRLRDALHRWVRVRA
jgi:PAS domain S-box-containing protein